MSRIVFSYSRDDESVEMKVNSIQDTEKEDIKKHEAKEIKKEQKIEDTELKQKPVKKVGQSRQKRFHSRFKDVPDTELILEHFACAILSDKILLQGMFYVTENHFAFYSNFLGYITKVLIPIDQVTDVSKNRKSLWQINTISVVTPGQNYDFTNFINHAGAYLAIRNQYRPKDENNTTMPLDNEDREEPEDDISYECPETEVISDDHTKSNFALTAKQPKIMDNLFSTVARIIPTGQSVFYSGAIGIIVGTISAMYLTLRIHKAEYKLMKLVTN